MKLGQSTKRLVKLVEDQNLVQWTKAKKEVLNLTTDKEDKWKSMSTNSWFGNYTIVERLYSQLLDLSLVRFYFN